MMTNRNALSVSVKYIFDKTGNKTVLVVETDLRLDPAEIDFEPHQVEALRKNLELHRQSIGYAEAVRLVRRRHLTPRGPVEVTGTFGGVTGTAPLKSA